MEKTYIDYVPEQRIEYVPVERTYTDYVEIKHEIEHVPIPKMEKRIEYIPVEKYEEYVDYVPL